MPSEEVERSHQPSQWNVAPRHLSCPTEAVIRAIGHFLNLCKLIPLVS